MGGSVSVRESSSSAKQIPLLVKSPQLDWLGEGKKGIILNGPAYQIKKPKGRGNGICIGPASDSILFTIDGPPGNMAIRCSEDGNLALEVNWRKYQVGTTLSLWANKGHREWACKFCLNEDMTISPVNDSPLKSFVLGVEKEGSSLILVPHNDLERMIVFEEVSQCLKVFAFEKTQREKEIAALQEPFPLLLKNPEMMWLGDGIKSIALNGNGYRIKKAKGRGNGICVRLASEAMLFKCDGTKKNMALRDAADEELALEVNYRQNKIGDGLSLWSCNGHPEWACKFAFNEDMTLSPVNNNGMILKNVVVGVTKGRASLILVARNDIEQRLVFYTHSAAISEYKGRIEREKAEALAKLNAQKQKAEQACNRETLQTLKQDGFFRFPQFVEKELLNEALKEINRQIGQSSSGVDQFKAKSFPSHPAITNLFNKSALPFLLEHLLGKTGSGPPQQGSGQLALRFPGDACQHNQCTITSAHYEGVRKGWHIDGCPNDFIPGVTDHYGEVHNFDALVGVLLSAVEEPMSGELCCYPGSHFALAEYFKSHGLEDVCQRGNAALPTGDKTDKVFESPPVNCIGNPGDIFIANYMTAHFIAPNTSPHIRYAVYFRVKGPGFSVPGAHFSDSMLQPWVHWKAILDLDSSLSECGDDEQIDVSEVNFHENHEEKLKSDNLNEHYSAVDNFHAIQNYWDINLKVFKFIHKLKEGAPIR